MTRRDGALLALLAGLLVLLNADPWLAGRTFFARDILHQFQPMTVFMAECLQTGRLPLWNPYVAGGATWVGYPQAAAFSPGHLPMWLFPFADGYNLFQALHLFLSAAGGYLLARAFGGRRGAALASGLLWGLNGLWRSRVEFPPLLGTLAWLPWSMLLLADRRLGRVCGAVLTGASLALALTAGHTTQFAWQGFFLAAWAAATGGRRALARLMSAAAAAAWAAAVPLLPVMDAVLSSGRAAGGIDPAQAVLFSWRPVQLLSLLWPPLGVLPGASFPGERYFWLSCAFVGVTGGLWTAFCFRGASPRRRATAAALFAAGALLVLGDRTPVYGFLYRHVPVFRWVRFPGHHAFWMVGACLALAAWGARGAARGWRRGALTLLAAALALELAAWGRRMQPTAPRSFLRERPDWIAPLQASTDGGWLFPSPGFLMDPGSFPAGASGTDVWRPLRERLLYTAGLPYHLRTLNPTSHLLPSASAERALDVLYGANSFAAAEPSLERWGVRWAITTSSAPHAGWLTRGPVPGGWLYEKADAGPRLSSDGRGTPWRRTWTGPGREVFSGGGRGGALLTGEMGDPGWRAFAPGGRPLAVLVRDGMESVSVPAGVSSVAMLYRPPSWPRALPASVAAWALLSAAALRRLRAAADRGLASREKLV